MIARLSRGNYGTLWTLYEAWTYNTREISTQNACAERDFFRKCFLVYIGSESECGTYSIFNSQSLGYCSEDGGDPYADIPVKGALLAAEWVRFLHSFTSWLQERYVAVVAITLERGGTLHRSTMFSYAKGKGVVQETQFDEEAVVQMEQDDRGEKRSRENSLFNTETRINSQSCFPRVRQWQCISLCSALIAILTLILLIVVAVALSICFISHCAK